MTERSVYLPDDLDAAARAAGLDLSEVLQAAVRAELEHQSAAVVEGQADVQLEQAFDSLEEARDSTEAQLEEALDSTEAHGERQS